MKLTAADSTDSKEPVFFYRPEAHDREHCLEVQLPFLQRRFASHAVHAGHTGRGGQYAHDVPPIVPIIISTNDFRKLKRMAEVLKPYFTDENLFIVSSDFSHYPCYEDACKVDALTGKAIETGDVEEFIATIGKNADSGIHNLATSACGELAIATLMLMLDKDYEVKHLIYQNSGDIGDTGHSRVVGYHAFAVIRKDKTAFSLSDQEKRVLKDIALRSIRDSLDGKPAKQPELQFQTANLQSKCGAFVSLHKHGRLRGCIGHFGEDVPLYALVAKMARAAAFEDPRFAPVRRDELDKVDIEISVLTPMRRIQSLDEFELHRHGIYIRRGYRSGTFLPQVADEVDWTKEEFVSHCSQDKAGLGWDGWKDAELYVYEAIVF
jgi:AmmeMemoRadiSam system protein A